MIMSMGEESEEAQYEIISREPLLMVTKDKDGSRETILVTFNRDGTMTWAKEGDPKPLTLRRK